MEYFQGQRQKGFAITYRAYALKGAALSSTEGEEEAKNAIEALRGDTASQKYEYIELNANGITFVSTSLAIINHITKGLAYVCMQALGEKKGVVPP